MTGMALGLIIPGHACRFATESPFVESLTCI